MTFSTPVPIMERAELIELSSLRRLWFVACDYEQLLATGTEFLASNA